MTIPDLDVLAERTGRALAARGWLLATAESCTGGGIGEAVTRVAGSSAWFDRGFITYSNRAKQALLGVTDEALARHGAVSERTVLEMAEGALAKSDADIAVAVSGVAGPGGGSPEKPVGTVCAAWVTRDGRREVRTFRFEGGRAEVRRATVAAALEGVMRLAEGAVTA